MLYWPLCGVDEIFKIIKRKTEEREMIYKAE